MRRMVVRTENGLGTGKRVQKEKFLGRKLRGGQRRTMLVGNFPDQGVSESGLFLQQFIIIGADTVRTHLLEMQRMGMMRVRTQEEPNNSGMMTQ